MKSLRMLFRICASAVALWLGICILIGIFAAESALHPLRRPLTSSDRAAAQRVAARQQGTLSDVSILARDGMTLRAWEIEPKVGKGDAAVLLHGQGDNRMGMLGAAEMLLRQGYSVLLPDARAHGETDGTIATYGVLEADDVRLWVDSLRQTARPRCIVGIGDSMGAGELLNSLRVENEFCAVVPNLLSQHFMR